jgi:hypothetical protein
VDNLGKKPLIIDFEFGPILFGDRGQALKSSQQNQCGNRTSLNWGEFNNKDLAIGIAGDAGYAAITGLLIGVGMNLFTKIWKDEEIQVEKVVKEALKTGADFAINVIAAGALKAGVEKDIIKVIPKGTPASTIGNVLYVGIQNIEILGMFAMGRLKLKEVLKEMGEVTLSTVAALAAGTIGTAIGEFIGTIFGPVGTFAGGYVGGVVGYILGAKVGENVTKGAKKVEKVARSVIKIIA